MFNGLKFALDSSNAEYKRGAVIDKIRQHGGVVSPCITKLVDFLICLDPKNGPQGLILRTAQAFNCPVLSVDFIEQSITQGQLLDTKDPQWTIALKLSDSTAESAKDDKFCCPRCNWPNTEVPPKPTPEPQPASSSSDLPDDEVSKEFLEPERQLPYPGTKSFDEMDLSNELLRGVYAYGFEHPSQCQARAIPAIISGKDVLFQAHSGTGKTGAYAIGLLQRLDRIPFNKDKQTCQAIVMCSSRELSHQVEQVIANLGEYLFWHSTFTHAFVGGTRVADDLKKAQCTTVAVGTTGRVHDVIKRGALRTDKIKLLVVDEADDFETQSKADGLYEVFKFMPKDVQFVACSAGELGSVWLKAMQPNWRVMTVPRKAQLLEGIKNFYVAVEEDWKYETLTDLYESISIAQSVIFCNSRRKVDWLADKLNQNEFTVSFMHADMAKGDREKVMTCYRSGSARVLITTEDLFRGIDVQHTSIVVNFDFPSSTGSFLHRVGRSGRYGRKGVSITLVTTADVGTLRALEEHFSTSIDELPMDFASHLE
eukprot:TRINITY_DN25025_c0_g1_i1.p1 TRINITY_DN25025_c0_g1~~TRINITY_DN25025_c0_g1_i1.p1  ORF type:complete len:539 (-),score=43.96 TRINITY_DN25025_c0_g1_i1:153-1769(-)